MLSLDNAFSDEELQAFFDRVRRFLERETDLEPDDEIAFACEPKIDGLSIACATRTAASPLAPRAATVRPARTSPPTCARSGTSRTG